MSMLRSTRRWLGRRLAVWLLVAVLTVRAPRTHAASAIAGALEPTQIANFIQLIQQCVKMAQAVKHAKQQVESWKTNLSKFKNMRHGELAGALVNDVSSLIGQYQSIAYGRDATIETFKKLYPGYQGPPGEQNYEQAYQNIDKSTMASLQRSMQAMDVQLKDEKGGIKAENELIKELADKMQSAEGVVQALNVTNGFLSVMTKQLQRLELTMISQGQAMNHYLAGEVQRRTYEEHARDQYFKFDKRAPPTPVDWSREGPKGFLR